MEQVMMSPLKWGTMYVGGMYYVWAIFY